jgi:actin-related protein
MAAKKSLADTLEEKGFSKKEIETMEGVLEAYKKDLDGDLALSKKALDEANAKLLAAETKKIAEAAEKAAKEKYIVDLDKAKADIQKECEEKTGKNIDAKLAAMSEELEKNTKMKNQSDDAEWKSKFMTEKEAEFKAKLAEALAALDKEMSEKLTEGLSLYKADLLLDATEKLQGLEEKIVGLIDPLVKDTLTENLSQSDIKNYVVNETNSKVLAAVMQTITENFVAPDTDGHKALMEKNAEIEKLKSDLAKSESEKDSLHENLDKMAKKDLIRDELANLPEEVKEKMATVSESMTFASASEAVRAMAKAYGLINETALAKPAEAAKEEAKADSKELSESERKEFDRLKLINNMFEEAKPVGITQEGGSETKTQTLAENEESKGAIDKKTFFKDMMAKAKAKEAKPG